MGKLDGVRQEVDQNLEIAPLVSKDPFKEVELIFVDLGLEIDLFEACMVLDSCEGLIDDTHEVDVGLVDLEGLILHLGEVQEVQHEDAHQLRSVLRLVQLFLDLVDPPR